MHNGWSRNPLPRSADIRPDSSSPAGQSADQNCLDTELRRLHELVESLQLRVDAERRSVDTLATKVREMTTHYHEILDREEKAIEGIALAMLERPADMGLLEYVEAIDEYTKKLRAENESLKLERDQHLSSLLRASVA